ncbi:glycosyltransferase family 2 protein [Candidatus Sneabacter namystus]|uniref:Glycosyltransferase n=1 Tax=Candidatus Sneabacter namystus TaxID=2601646 RepID=A0A5C0UI14_9RICK|nr:glycosyltransferase family 2 protein [Candidatus Sneabacter namystus]QEK39706.1 glycosyltransferase [Candidatus Sneabacter namystus]
MNLAQLIKYEYEDIDLLFLSYLLERKFLCKAQVSYALLAHASCCTDLVMILLEAGFIQYEKLLLLLSQFFGIKQLSSKHNMVVVGNYAELNDYCKRGYFECTDQCNKTFVISTVCDTKLLIQLVSSYSLERVLLCRNKDFFFILDSAFQRYSLAQSTSFVKFINKVSAKNVCYGRLIFLLVCTFYLFLIKINFIFHLINIAVLVIQNFFKGTLILTSAIKRWENNNAELDYFAEYPCYSILIPAYKEKHIARLLDAVSRFLYPKHKLDVKLLIEQDDDITNLAIKQYNIPFYVHVVYIPKSVPRTKPKAMNFAMPYVKGQYVTVYDAEDIPEPAQLIKSVHAFANLPLDYVCVQAKLRFYNAKENLLTKLMSIEYSVLFNFLVRGLNLLKFPIPLGGTSNHFRTSALKQVGCWDAYNVAEDADLGIRIFAHKYKVGVIDSFTSEEAPIDLSSWIKQRVRWLKGYWQTFFIFVYKRRSYGVKDTIGVISFVGFATYGQLIFPLAFILTFFAKTPFVQKLWLVNTYISMSYVILASILGIRAAKLVDHPLQYIYMIPCYFLYFLLHSIASVFAILELAFAPFQWNKTEHGVSKLTQKWLWKK